LASDHDIRPESAPGQSQKTVSTRFMEMFVALAFMIVASVVMADSWRVGAGWAFDGPEAGYFPFYIGLIMFVASAVTFGVHALAGASDRPNFVDRSALLMVLKILAPTIVFVFLIGYLGLYVAAGLFIILFMCWLGRFRLMKAIPVGIVIPLILFWMFEIAFLIPLPKGPLEAAFGY
jgi:hypothetical protein